MKDFMSKMIENLSIHKKLMSLIIKLYLNLMIITKIILNFNYLTSLNKNQILNKIFMNLNLTIKINMKVNFK